MPKVACSYMHAIFEITKLNLQKNGLNPRKTWALFDFYSSLCELAVTDVINFLGLMRQNDGQFINLTDTFVRKVWLVFLFFAFAVVRSPL